jgi:hypothetical protein
MRIGSEAPRRRTHSSSRHDSHESHSEPRHFEPSSAIHHKRNGLGPKTAVTSARSVHGAGRMTMPSGTTPSRTNRLRRSEACAPRRRSCECRDLSKLDRLVIQIDGLHIGNDLGIDADGDKDPFGPVKGAIEKSSLGLISADQNNLGSFH